VSGHAREVDSLGADFHDEQDMESVQRDGVEGEEVGGQQSGGLGVQERPPASVWMACGGGPRRAAVRIRRMVPAPRRCPSPVSSPWIRR
jgi:hypothetical protein